MKIKNKDTEVNQGFSLKDQNYLRIYDNAAADPPIQMFTEEELEDEEPEQRTYFCAYCKSRLDHLQLGVDDTIWRCNNCMAYYDTNIQDMPLKDISSAGVKTYPEFQYYPVFEEDGQGMIFMQGINPDEQRSTPKNVEILRDDHRVKHIRVKGSLVEALSAMNEMDGLQ